MSKVTVTDLMSITEVIITQSREFYTMVQLNYKTVTVNKLKEQSYPATRRRKHTEDLFRPC